MRWRALWESVFRSCRSIRGIRLGIEGRHGTERNAEDGASAWARSEYRWRVAVAIPQLKPTFGRFYRRAEAAIGRAIFERGDLIDTSPVEYFDVDLPEDYKHYAPSSWPMLPRALRKV